MAAIEHMEEGFALYDSDDRLVICNGRYLSAFMPEMEGELVSGMRFEEIVTRPPASSANADSYTTSGAIR